MSYQKAYDYVKLTQETSSESYPTVPHYVVIIFNSDSSVSVWTTTDKDKLKSNIIALHAMKSNFVFFYVPKIGKLILLFHLNFNISYHN